MEVISLEPTFNLFSERRSRKESGERVTSKDDSLSEQVIDTS